MKVDPDGHAVTPDHWLRLGYLIIGALLLARLAYLASGKIELSEDEAYQWLWSKHLALSYYSKPPLIAWVQFAGTSLWGDSAFGIRFFSPVIAAILAAMMLRFFAREVNARAGFWLVLVVTATPLLAVGSTLMTIDPLSVLFWTAAMLSGWQAVRRDSTKDWLWVGLWTGLGFLSKYTALFQLLSWALFLALWKPARAQLIRPGPYLALLIAGLCALPVLVWNWQHDWITVTHLTSRAGLDQAWKPTLKYFLEFIGSEFGLLNPVFFVAMIWAGIQFWKMHRDSPLHLFLFSMGAPVFVIYTLFSFRSRVQPNWIAPSVVPLFALMILFWEERIRKGDFRAHRWLRAGTVFGLVTIILLHDTNLIVKIAGRPLPSRQDPLTRVRGWKEAARMVADARRQLMTAGGKVFVIGDHYGITGLMSFYIPEARAGVPDAPQVYYLSSPVPRNQFFFWPGYRERRGEDAVFVQTSRTPEPPPPRLVEEFESVTDLGVHEIEYRGRILHRIQLFACRGLR